jgi:hypothetical protein
VSPEETTQQMRAVRPDDATEVVAPLPGSLDVGREDRTPDRTEVLSLDELFPPVPEPAAPVAPTPPTPPAAPAAPLASADAPTWTAMPVPQPPAAPAAPAQPAAADRRREVVDRVRADAQAALAGTRRRGEEWLRAGDNLVILLTALIALVLLLAVAALAS